MRDLTENARIAPREHRRTRELENVCGTALLSSHDRSSHPGIRVGANLVFALVRPRSLEISRLAPPETRSLEP